jgi:prophage regulatory protein
MTRFISMRQLKDLIGLSKTTIYKRISSGTFPRSVPLGPKRVVFVETEIEAWMRKQIRQGRKEVHSSSVRQARAVKAVGLRRDRRTAP